jgi:putative ATP-binding cassette transporter
MGYQHEYIVTKIQGRQACAVPTLRQQAVSGQQMKLPFDLKILDFLQKETRTMDGKVILMTAVSGTSNAALLAVINNAVASIPGGGPAWYHLVMFALILVLFGYSLNFILCEASRIAEEAVRNVRVRLADKVRRLDLEALEAIGEADIHGRIVRETSAVAQSARPMFAAAQSVLMLVFTMGYILLVSPMAWLLVAGILGGGTAIYLRDRQRVEDDLKAAATAEDQLTTNLTGLLKGFKEVRLNRAKSDDVFHELRATATQVQDIRTATMLLFSKNVVFVELFFLTLIGSLVFVLPVLSPSFSTSVTKIVAAVLYQMGPLGNVVMMIPVLAQVNVTLGNLQGLEDKLDEGLRRMAEVTPVGADPVLDFQTIQFEGVTFRYRAPDGTVSFQMGPVDEQLRRGEVLFLVGGNGSGKTTLLKLITALYHPQEGCIRVDGVAVGPANVQSYRHLFSAIFSDFHLFDKLHGLRNAQPEQVDLLLRRMNIAHKTAFLDGSFSNILLSTGQRKRLALVVSYLEDKPILIFDEVAADQDPEFRVYFYETMLKELKEAGKTVVVVSHDDRYFHCADRVLVMNYGRLVEITPVAAPAAKAVASRRPRKAPVA